MDTKSTSTTFYRDYLYKAVGKEAAIKAVEELFHTKRNGTASWFTAQLYLLIAKADSNNIEKLAEGFPAEVEAYRCWCAAGDYGNDLFVQFGISSVDNEQSN